MNTSSRVSSLAAGLVLGVALFPASPASAAELTNPADHPAPVTIKVDGQEYKDGLDTLPGFDDYACTPIPGVEYDFASNRILYYDGDNNLLTTAKWTEWARTTSYQTWVDQQTKASAPSPSSSPSSSSPSTAAADTPNPSPAAAETPAAANAGGSTQSAAPSASTTSSPAASAAGSTASTSGGKKSGPKGSSSTGGSSRDTSSSGAATGTTAAGAASGETIAADGVDVPGSTPVASAAGGDDPQDASSPGSTAGIAGPPTPAGVTATPSTKPLAKAVRKAGEGANDTRLAGVGILGALSLAGIALLSGNFVRRGPLGLGGTSVKAKK